MSKVLGIFMSKSDAPAAVTTTVAGRFDAAVCDFAWHNPSISNLGTVYVFTHPVATGDITWYHFAMKVDPMVSSDDGYIHEMTNVGGDVILRIDTLDGRMRLQAIGQTTVYSSFMEMPVSLTRFDIKIDVSGSDLVTSMYIEGGIEPALNSTVPVATRGKPGQIKIQINDMDDIYTSEVYVADFDTRNTRPVKQTPDATGNYSAWTGGYSELGDEDEMTVATGAVAGDKVSMNIETYPGPVSPGGINRLVMKIVGSRGASGPQDIDPFVRIAGTDYSAGGLTPTETPLAMYAEFSINPATSLPWTTADLNTTEIGLEAKT